MAGEAMPPSKFLTGPPLRQRLACPLSATTLLCYRRPSFQGMPHDVYPIASSACGHTIE
jgi:hypothetical protein